MSGQDMKCFGFEDNLVRVVMKSGAPWFVAADVCRVLGLKNTAMAVKSLDEDERGVSSTYTLGGSQEVLTISEGGLYTMILRSRAAMTPGSPAHRFRKWVTAEVLPAIRKTGSFVAEKSTVPSKATWREQNRIRYHKMRLVEAVQTLDECGIDVTVIDMKLVRDFGRHLLAKKAVQP